MSGTLYGIGVGPGDPELLTLKAYRLLQSVPVIAWPAPEAGEGMARTIASAHIPAGKIEIPIRLGFRPERDDTDRAYGEAARVVSAHLDSGRDVGVLCEGDPLFFGSFIHLLARLPERFTVEVVPGISSPMAAAALAQTPLASLDDSVAMITATRPEDEIERLLALTDTAVIMKVGRHLPKIRRVLDRLGLAPHARLIERVGLAGEKVHELGDMTEAESPYFSLILVRRNREPNI